VSHNTLDPISGQISRNLPNTDY